MRASLLSLPHIISLSLQGKACHRKAATEGTTLFCTFSYFISAREFALILRHLRQVACCWRLFNSMNRKDRVQQYGTECV
jgi:hypothetical protein